MPARITLTVTRGKLQGQSFVFDERTTCIVGRAEDFMLAVSGDPLRTNAYTFVHNGILGYPVCKQIHLPAQWRELLGEAKAT